MASLVWRCISPHIRLRPAASRLVLYSDAEIPGHGMPTPLSQRRASVAFERVKGKREWAHAADLIAEREETVLFMQLKEARERGALAEVEALLDSSDFARKHAASGRGYKGFYCRFVAKLHAASNEAGLASVFREAEGAGFSGQISKGIKALSADQKWARYKTKEASAAEKRWGAYAEHGGSR